MKNKLITILTVTAVATSGLIAVAGVALNHNLSPLGSIEANDTRYLEIKAEDIRDAIGAGSEGTFTVAGIEFFINNASYDNGVANVNGGILETRTTAGQSVSPITGMAGTGYLAAEFVNMAAASGGNLMTKDDDKALIAEHPFGAYTQESYVLDFSEDNTPSRKVSNLFIAFGAGGGISFTSLKFAYKCEVPPTKHTVTFMNGEDVYDTQLVIDGEKAVRPETDPTKDPDSEVAKYVFKGWDKDLDQAITDDLVVNAVYDEYARKMMLDDFEEYEVDAELADAGWFAIGWVDGGWSKNTKANVVLSANSIEGNQALRFNSFRNNMGYFIRNEIETNSFDRLANAVNFSLMAPGNPTSAKLLITLSLPLPAPYDAPVIKHPISVTTGEYVNYTIPFDANGWTVWDDPVNLREMAATYGLNCDEFVQAVSQVEIYLQYGEVSPSDYAAFLDSFSFVTVEGSNIVTEENFKTYTTYTGTTLSGNVVKVELATDGTNNATASVIDLEEPIVIPGKITLGEGYVMTFTSNTEGALTYSGRLTNGAQKIKFVSASGAYATVLGEMELDAVQVVENCEQYATDGQAYCIKYPDPAARSGARGAYYSEFYSNKEEDSSPWGGKKWSLMGGEGDQLKLKTDGGHSGSKYLCMKNSNDKAMRYMQWGLFDGTADKQSYRGSKLSFWAKTNGTVKSIKVYAYYQSKPTNATKDNYVSTDVWSNQNESTWKRYEVALKPDQVYYGFVFLLEASWTGDHYLYVDDVEVFSANPYAEYVPPVTDFDVIQKAEYMHDINGFGRSSLVFTSDTEATYNIPVLSSTLNLSYSISDDQLDLVHNSEHMKATISEDSSTLTFEEVTVTSQFTACFSGATYALAPVLENAESYTETGKTYSVNTYDLNQISGAGGAYHVDFYKENASNPSLMGDKNWSVPTANNNHVQLDKSVSRDGSQSLKIYFNSGFQFRYIQMGLMRGTATKAYTGYNRLGIWVKNTSEKLLKFKLWAFKTSQVNSSTLSQRDVTDFMEVPAGQDWTLYTLALNQASTYYGYGLFTDKPSSGDARLYVDRVFFFNDYDSIDNLMALKEGSKFDGTIVPGAASITFGAKNAFTFTCANAGKTDEAGTFKTYMDGDVQKVELSVLDTTIVCSYAIVPAESKLTLTVLSATGALASYIPVDTVFSYIM